MFEKILKLLPILVSFLGKRKRKSSAIHTFEQLSMFDVALKKKRYLEVIPKLIFLFLLPFSAFSQNNDSAKWSRFSNLYSNAYRLFKPEKLISANSDVILSTIHITNAFIYPFVFHNKLQQATINKAVSTSGSKELSTESNNEIRFMNLDSKVFNKNSINWYLNAGVHSRQYTYLTNDAMRLMFKGNTDTNTYLLSNCSHFNLLMNKIGGGLFYHVEKVKRPFNLSFGLNLQQALTYENVETEGNNYYKGNEDSFKVRLDYNATFASSNSFLKNGLGMGSEIIFNQRLDAKSTWGVRAENFGFVNFKKKATTYSSNGTFTFNGVFIPDIGRIGDDGYLKGQLDSITNPLTNKEENQSKTVWIAPTSFAYFCTHIGQGYYQVGLRYRGTKAVPVAEFRYSSFIKTNLLLGATIGTIGNYYVNADINWAITKKIFIQAGIFHIEALLFPNQLGGSGGNFGLQFVL